MAKLWAGWTWDPTVVLALGVAAGLYVVGWRRLRRRARRADAGACWRVWCFAMALLALAGALLSPIGTYDERLFVLHMAQHLLLIQVAAPLLLLGGPLVPILWALPVQERRGVMRLASWRPVHGVLHALTEPVVAVVLFVGALAVWHVPVLYDAAQGRTVLHDLEHAVFLGTAVLFWWPVIHPTGGWRRLGYGRALVYVLPPLVEGHVLGAFLYFAPQPVYATYRLAAPTAGLSALQDQQLGGLVMWPLGGFGYGLTLLALAAVFLRAEELAVRQAELTRRGPGASRRLSRP